MLLHLKREQTVKDLTQKLSNLPLSPQEEKPQNRIGDMTGLISKAKEELAKSKSKADLNKTNVDDLKKPEPKKSEIELHWEELVNNMERDFTLCDLDFTDLALDEDPDILAPKGFGSNIPPPPPPGMVPPPMRNNGLLNGNGAKQNGTNGDVSMKKSKKTVSDLFADKQTKFIETNIMNPIQSEINLYSDLFIYFVLSIQL